MQEFNIVVSGKTHLDLMREVGGVVGLMIPIFLNNSLLEWRTQILFSSLLIFIPVVRRKLFIPMSGQMFHQ